MDLILLTDIDTLGFKYDVVKVKDGYGRNFLIPRKLGIIANKTNMAKLNKIKEAEAAKEAARKGEYEEIAAKLNGQTLKIGVKAGTSGKIFGSVTGVQVIKAIQQQFEISIDRRKVELPEEIKNVGTYPAILKLHPEVTSEVSLELVEE